MLLIMNYLQNNRVLVDYKYVANIITILQKSSIQGNNKIGIMKFLRRFDRDPVGRLFHGLH
jgi:hypothetical protein